MTAHNLSIEFAVDDGACAVIHRAYSELDALHYGQFGPQVL